MSAAQLYNQVPYSDIFEHVRPDVPLVSMPNVERTLSYVALDFFRYTNAWEVFLESIPVLSGIRMAGLGLEQFGDQVRLNRTRILNFDGCKLKPESETTLQTQFGGSWRDRTGTPEFYVTDRSDSVLLAPVPVKDGTLSGQVSIKPTLHTRCLPEDLYEEYLDVLRAGVLGRLMNMSNKRWSDRDGAAQYSAVYLQGRDDAMSHVMLEDTPKLRVTQYGGY